jgi:hypothetical protein
VLLIAGMGASGFAAAQNNFDAKFEVVPAVAGPGVARKISISLITGCQPEATVLDSYEIARKRTLTVRLDQPNPFFCDALMTRTVAVTYTPQAEGDLRLLVVTNSGVYVGETTIRTRAAGSNRSQFDLTGMWYDPVTNGSGLTFVHGFSRDDVTFGTWYVYDALGVARWYTIQGMQWKSGGLEATGFIYETTAQSMACMPPLIGCPVPFATVFSPARARIVMQGPNSAQIQALTPDGAVLFTSNIIRSIF